MLANCGRNKTRQDVLGLKNKHAIVMSLIIFQIVS